MNTRHRDRRSRFPFPVSALLLLLVTFQSPITASAATVTANPANWPVASSPGDTISFVPGIYAINGTPANPTGGFASGRIYVGNGAVFNNASGGGAISFANLADVDFSGFVLNGVQVRGDNLAQTKIHDNTFQNISSDAIVLAGTHDTQIVHNKLAHVGGQGVYGYPGDNLTVGSNAFDYVWEGIHLASSTCSNMDVSNNLFTHIKRFAIELQVKVTGLTVTNNWMGDWLGVGQGHMGISCATGFGKNITISGNTLLMTGDSPGALLWTCAAIEIFGSNVTIASNYAYNWNCLILNGAEPGGLDSTNNTVIGGHLTDYDNVGGAYQIGPVHSAGDKLYALNDASAPKPPAAPGTAAATQPSPIASPIASPITAAAGPIGGQLIVSFPSGAHTLAVYPSTLSPSTAVQLGTVTGASATVTNIPNSWFVTAVVDGAAATPVQVMGGPIGGAFSPSLALVAQSPPAVVPATQPAQTQPGAAVPQVPTLTHTIRVFSDGSIQTQ